MKHESTFLVPNTPKQTCKACYFLRLWHISKSCYILRLQRAAFTHPTGLETPELTNQAANPFLWGLEAPVRQRPLASASLIKAVLSVPPPLLFHCYNHFFNYTAYWSLLHYLFSNSSCQTIFLKFQSSMRLSAHLVTRFQTAFFQSTTL